MYCIVSCCVVARCTTSYGVALRCVVLCCAVLCHIVLYGVVWCGIALHYVRYIISCPGNMIGFGCKRRFQNQSQPQSPTNSGQHRFRNGVRKSCPDAATSGQDRPCLHYSSEVCKQGRRTTGRSFETENGFTQSGGAKRATSVNVTPLHLQSSERKFKMTRELEPVRRSFCRHGSCTFTEVARLVHSGISESRFLGHWVHGQRASPRLRVETS